MSDTDVAGLPPGNVRVPHHEFVAVWRAATARDGASALDWYAGAVASTCRWLATSATQRDRVAYEELIEAEYLEASVLDRRRPRLAQARPGWCEGVRDTLRWARRREGRPPYEVAMKQPAH